MFSSNSASTRWPSALDESADFRCSVHTFACLILHWLLDKDGRGDCGRCSIFVKRFQISFTGTPAKCNLYGHHYSEIAIKHVLLIGGG